MADHPDPGSGAGPAVAITDRSLAFAADPYRFIGSLCDAAGRDVAATRLLMQPALCMRGEEAARVFYDPERFERAGAAPEPVQATLFGKGGVQGLDGAAHRQRKALFIAATAPERVQLLLDHMAAQWRDAAARWARVDRVVLHDAVCGILARAVCAWAQVPLPQEEWRQRTRQLTALFDDAAGGPVRHLRARLARKAAEAWLSRWVQEVREGRLRVAPGSAMHAVAWHRDAGGEQLAPRVAAVELLNLLRPTVAVAVYITFAAHALQAHPGWMTRLRRAAPEEAAGLRRAFAQEVRRCYPFFPVVVARVKRHLEWQGTAFEPGTRALLDLYGGNHDPRVWPEPHAFRPERFLGAEPGPFAFVPQGGGDVATQHRCPGEGITLALTAQAIEVLTCTLRYDVPPQDLDIDMARLPPLPRSRFVIAAVRLREPA